MITDDPMTPSQGKGSPSEANAPSPSEAEAMTKALDILTYTPLPSPDPLCIHGWDSIKTTENVSPTQIGWWNGDEGAKVPLYRAYGKKRIEDDDEIIQVTNLIQAFLGTTAELIIAPPIPEDKRTKKEDPPHCTLLQGISPEQAEILINKVSPPHLLPNTNTNPPSQRFISTAEVTVMIIPFDPPPTSFVTTLKGFMFIGKNDAQTETEVARIVDTAMFSDDKPANLSTRVRRFIANHRDNVPKAIINIDDVLRFVCLSITVKRLNLLKREDIGTGVGKPTPVWNVYIFPPTKDQSAMREWREIIRKTGFVTAANRLGSTNRIFNCKICLSEDHPAGMCPYPSQRGWIAPTPPPTIAPSPVVEAITNPVQPNRDARTSAHRGRGTQSNPRGRNATNRKGKVNAKS